MLEAVVPDPAWWSRDPSYLGMSVRLGTTAGLGATDRRVGGSAARSATGTGAKGGTVGRSARRVPTASDRQAGGSVLRTGVLLGVGTIGALDEIVLHQLVQWHHFYDHGDEFGRIVSDGLLHLFTLTMLLLGASRLWSTRRAIGAVLSARPLRAGLLLGMGGFQLFDGVVNHKVLRLHQIRADVDNVLPYDIAWNAIALLLLAAGWISLTADRSAGGRR